HRYAPAQHREFPRECVSAFIQKVDMIDAAAMRNLATPAQLEAFAEAGEGAAGEIKVIPMWETSSALVLALGEEISESAVGKVRNAISEAV
ncbi:unnamed protein product, partial [Ectocarpus sp. 12 AP-2014]